MVHACIIVRYGREWLMSKLRREVEILPATAWSGATDKGLPAQQAFAQWGRDTRARQRGESRRRCVRRPAGRMSALTFDVEQFKFVTSAARDREIARWRDPRDKRRQGEEDAEGKERESRRRTRAGGEGGRGRIDRGQGWRLFSWINFATESFVYYINF